MKIPTCCSCFTSLALVTLSTVPTAHALSCACVAQQEGFAIDCDNSGALTGALAALIANDCDTDCMTEVCRRNYSLIQSHHDYCLATDNLPATLEDPFHLYEAVCDDCTITKKYQPGLPDCPIVDCADGNQAWTVLIANDCVTDCSSAACRENFRTLKVVHDTCHEDTLSPVAETNYHDVEEACHVQHDCNLVESQNATPLVCVDTSEAAAASFAVLGVVAAVGIMTMI